MKYSRFVLKIVGTWPDHKNKQLAYFHFMFVAIFVFTWSLLTQNVQLFIMWGNLDVISDILSCAYLPILVSLIKMTVLWCYRKKLNRLLLLMAQDWDNIQTEEEYTIMTKYGKISKKFSKITISVAVTTNTSRLIQVLYMNINIWRKIDVNGTHVLYLDGYVPYEWNYTPAFEITNLIIYLSVFVGNLSYCGTDSFFYQLAFHFCGQFKILQCKISNIISKDENGNISEEFLKNLSHIVRTHERINRCIEIIEDSFNLMLLAQLLSCSLLFCVQGYQLVYYTSEKSSSSILFGTVFIVFYITYMLGNFCIYCYVAELLQVKSTTLALAVYNCEWFNLPCKKSKNFLLIVSRSRKPVNISAGKFCVIDLRLFGQILKTSLGYLSFLLTMKKS